MFEDNKKKEEPKEYTFDKNNIQGCDHNFVRKGPNVECTKCGLGFYDPKMEFPATLLQEKKLPIERTATT